MAWRRQRTINGLALLAIIALESASLLTIVRPFPLPTSYCKSTSLSTSHHVHQPCRCYAVGDGRIAGLPNPGNSRRREKRNKYATFSKVGTRRKDPLEELIAESESKVRQLEIEKTRRRNGTVPRQEGHVDEKRERNQILFPDTKAIDPYDPSTYGYTELGTITGAHGVHGLLKINAITEFQERLCRPGVRHIKAPNRRSPRQVNLLDGRRRLGDEFLIKLEGIGDRDSANKLRGSVLYARQEERPEELEEDEYLVQDLVGLEVFLEEGYREGSSANDLGGRFVGTVCAVVLAEDMCSVPGLGQDMLEVALPRGLGSTPSWRDELVLIPFVPQIVPRVDLEARTVKITPPDGLLDLTYIREEKIRIKGFLPPAED